MNGYVSVMEWQKRGLPHTHILIWLKDGVSKENIDKIVSAEIPDKESDPELFGLVTEKIVHGPHTAHSAFKLPFNIAQIDEPNCNVTANSPSGIKIKKSDLIVWNECSMAHKRFLQ